jgi:hypothetical protein
MAFPRSIWWNAHCVCLAATFAVLAIDAPSNGASTAPGETAGQVVKDAARDLESTVFAERESAMKRLSEARGAAVPALTQTAKDGNLEAAVRAIAVLESIFVSADRNDDVASLEAAEFALDELSRTARPAIADRADVSLQSHVPMRERRAMAAIERLNGRLKFLAPMSDLPRWNLQRNTLPFPGDQPPDPVRGELSIVIIGPKWKGGDEGLKHVARLKRFQSLYRIEGRQVTEAGIAGLQSRLPGTSIDLRGAAKLGIGPMGYFEGEKGCAIDQVEEGEAAANAGLRTHDVIVKFGNKDIENFNSLVNLLRGYKPGDTTEAGVIRNGKRIAVRVTLTGWD